MTVNERDTIVSYDDFYPYGMQMGGRSYSSGNVDSRYKPACRQAGSLGRNLPSAGKLDATTGLDYFGARYYDSWRGQWAQVDPNADFYPEVSPYVYCNDNPVNRIDPDGCDPDPVPTPGIPPIVVVAPRVNNTVAILAGILVFSLTWEFDLPVAFLVGTIVVAAVAVKVAYDHYNPRQTVVWQQNANNENVKSQEKKKNPKRGAREKAKKGKKMN